MGGVGTVTTGGPPGATGPQGPRGQQGPPGAPGPAGGVAIVNLTGPTTQTAVANAEYTFDVRGGPIGLTLPPGMPLSSVVQGVHVAGSLSANPVTITAPTGVQLGQPAPNNGTTAAAIVFNDDRQAGFSFGWWNYGISGVYNIK